MRSLWQVLLLLLLTLRPALVTAAPVVTALRVGDQDPATRLVLQFSEPVTYNIFTLPDPYRLVIDLPALSWSVSPDEVGNVGVVSRLRIGTFKPGTTRAVFDLSGPVRVVQSFMLPPSSEFGYRLVVDVEPVATRAFKPMISGSVQPVAAIAPAVPPPVRPRSKPVIAIDAGHGGDDPGAIGVSGGYEKHVTLAAARELKAAFEATGRYRVFMTRDRDVFVRLRDRVLRARKAGADLFISLHADSIGSSEVRGLSVYTLSEQASDREAGALAARENKADLIAGVNLTGVAAPEVVNILIDLAQRETMNLSAEYARMLVDDLSDRTALLPDTHRFAGFAVLKAPDVPSVLIELGYLSNPTEERLLREARYRSRLIEAITRATDRFFAYKNGLGRS